MFIWEVNLLQIILLKVEITKHTDIPENPLMKYYYKSCISSKVICNQNHMRLNYLMYYYERKLLSINCKIPKTIKHVRILRTLKCEKICTYDPYSIVVLKLCCWWRTILYKVRELLKNGFFGTIWGLLYVYLSSLVYQFSIRIIKGKQWKYSFFHFQEQLL